MNWYKRYTAVETVGVYEDILQLGPEALSGTYQEEVHEVMTEMFKWISFNLNVIYNELIEIGYLFKTDGTFNFEKPIHLPLEETELLIEKTRFLIKKGNLVWEIDEFKGENQGLIVAEVELNHEDQDLKLPSWIGEEVSQNPKYFNSSLINLPFTKWTLR